MKVVLKYTFAGLVMLAYIVSIVGVSVYHCHCTHSTQIAWPVAHSDCACAHAHRHVPESACSHHCSAKSAEDEAPACGGSLSDRCCTVVVEQLDTDQELPAVQKIATYFYTVFHSHQPAAMFTTATPALAIAVNNSSPPLLSEKHSLLSRMAQWRL